MVTVLDMSTPSASRRLGNSGLVVSTAGLGCNNLGRPGTASESLDGSRAVVHAAIEAGITLFDVADFYGSEPGVSETALGMSLTGKRDQVVLATKFGLPVGTANGRDDGARGSRRYIRQSVEASLRRLKTDWIDLYQLHTPDPLTPIDETLSALDDLVRAGLVRYIGHSNFAGWQAADADWTARTTGTTRFISAQNEYSMLSRGIERDLLPAADRFGLGVLPFFPLANGLLTGKYSANDAPVGSRITDSKPHLLESAPWDVVEAVRAFAAQRDLSMIDVAFGWLLAHPAVSSVIAGATTPAQVTANAASAVRWVPTSAELDELDALTPAPAR